MSHRLIALAAAAFALQACAPTARPPAGPTEDLNAGIAKSCEASAVDLSAAASATATITLSNDGWCAVRAVEKDGKPFLLGLVKQRPEHGHVLIQKIGGQTRLEYTANPRYSGADRFSVALRSRTSGAADATVQVAVTVTPGSGVAVAPEPAPAPAPSRTPPARPRTPARPATR